MEQEYVYILNISRSHWKYFNRQFWHCLFFKFIVTVNSPTIPDISEKDYGISNPTIICNLGIFNQLYCSPVYRPWIGGTVANAPYANPL